MRKGAPEALIGRRILLAGRQSPWTAEFIFSPTCQRIATLAIYDYPRGIFRGALEFPRYTLKGGIGGEEYRGFQRIVQGFLAFFPKEHRPRLSTDNVLSLQKDSVGCIGNLVDWFVEAINWCLFERAESLEWRHFEMTALTDGKFDMLSKQCAKDERVIRKVMKRDGCGLARGAALKEKQSKEREAAFAEAAAKEGEKRRKTRVGEQNPVRHRMSGR